MANTGSKDKTTD